MTCTPIAESLSSFIFGKSIDAVSAVVTTDYGLVESEVDVAVSSASTTTTAISATASVDFEVSGITCLASGIDLATEIDSSSPVAVSTIVAREVVPTLNPSLVAITGTSVVRPVSDKVEYIAPQASIIADVGTIIPEDDKVAFETSASVLTKSLSSQHGP